MHKLIGVRTLKTGIGATLSMLIAQSLNLNYSSSAGIITILSIQSTKKQSIQMAINRFYATIIALVLSSILFITIDFNIVVFGLFLILFIPIASKLNIVEGIVPASVLVTHLLGEGIVTFDLLINELLLFTIGATVGLLLNLYMPSVEENLHTLRHQVENQMYDLLTNMSEALLSHDDEIANPSLFDELEANLKLGKSISYKQSNNSIFSDLSLYERYFDMRFNQFQVLCYMKEHFRRFFVTYEETVFVSDFTIHIAKSVHGLRTSQELLEDLEIIRNYFQNSKLPSSREEFENRAMLYQFLNDLEHFLEIKQDFKETLSDEEIIEYMNGYTLS